MRVAGVDGCKAGWVVCHSKGGRIRFDLAPTFKDVFKIGDFKLVAVDMPIGFSAEAEDGGRECERALREILGPKRRSSVFPSPCRPTLAAVYRGSDKEERKRHYEMACRINRENSIGKPKGIPLQTFAILPKICEVDAFLRSGPATQVFEAHPEFAFALMSRTGHPKPIARSKASAAGLAIRIGRLKRQRIDLDPAWRDSFRTKDAGPDDLLDAAACYWTAVRLDEKRAETLPKTRPLPIDPVIEHEMSISA